MSHWRSLPGPALGKVGPAVVAGVDLADDEPGWPWLPVKRVLMEVKPEPPDQRDLWSEGSLHIFVSISLAQSRLYRSASEAYSTSMFSGPSAARASVLGAGYLRKLLTLARVR